MTITNVVGIATGVMQLIFISLVHVYWAAGGTAGKVNSIPQRDGEPLFRPSATATLLVAALLAAAAFVVIGGLWIRETPGVNSMLHWGNLLLAGVFGLRAVGDFRWAGFFKRVRGSAFAKWDTWLYSPLCALLSAGCVQVAIGARG